MSRVPRISGQKAIRAFKKAGFALDRVCGSHHMLEKTDNPNTLSIPVHAGKTVGVGLLKEQIKAAGLTVQQFIELL